MLALSINDHATSFEKESSSIPKQLKNLNRDYIVDERSTSNISPLTIQSNEPILRKSKHIHKPSI